MRRLVLLLSLTACKASIGDGMDDAGTSLDDGALADASPDGPAVLPPWQPPTPVPITPVGDDDPSLTGDLLELYFNRNSDIFVATRTSITGAWGTPIPVPELNSAAVETTPEISYDGLTIYFASARTPTLGGNDIWMATRASRTAAWSTPVHVTELSSANADGAPALAGTLAIVIDSDRASATMLDTYIATRATPGAAFGAPIAIDEVNSANAEGNPMLSEDRLALYFDSNRTGDSELFVATRATPTAAFGAPVRLTELGSPGADSDPWISPDGRTLYFTSDRDGTTRLWQTTR